MDKTNKQHDFKKLQLKWYKKLDKSGFNDIERSGKNRQEYFNEYSGILQKPLSILKRTINSSTLTHYSAASKFAATAQKHTILSPKYLKLHKSVPLSTKIDYSTDIVAEVADSADPAYNDILILQIKSVRLSPIQRCILRLYSTGATIAATSAHLRSYYAHRYADQVRPGRKGQPFSDCYVHYHLKKLLKLLQLHQAYLEYADESV